jgi:hypothetical protein
MPSSTKKDLRQRCALALTVIVLLLAFITFVGISLGRVLSSDATHELEAAVHRAFEPTERWAWRSARDSNSTFARLLRVLPRARVLRPPSDERGLGSWIVTSDNFVSRAEARAIIAWAEHGRFERGASGGNGSRFDTRRRNCSVAWCKWHGQCGASTRGAATSLLARVESATGIGRHHYEDLQVLRYVAGEYNVQRKHQSNPASGLASSCELTRRVVLRTRVCVRAERAHGRATADRHKDRRQCPRQPTAAHRARLSLGRAGEPCHARTPPPRAAHVPATPPLRTILCSPPTPLLGSCALPLSPSQVGSGGETAFTKLNVPPVVPRLGRLVVWPNVMTDETAGPRADIRMYHEAQQLTRGVKYAANIWVRLSNRRHRLIWHKGTRDLVF